MTDIPHKGTRADEQVVLLAAGLLDLAVSTVGTAVGAARLFLRRSDGAEIAKDVHHDLRARGRIVLDRYATAPTAHLEVLAQHAVTRRAASGADA
ncbi:polyprenyl synthetase [Streptomyces sp. NPDC057740]|uniref:polyprenyl synthetase n=1 Tax=Streptomyces sp. NPDC057740 TaxID=3346234 RepID=UPI00369730F1